MPEIKPALTAEERGKLDNVKLSRQDETVAVDLEYPRMPGNARRLEVGLVDVRAADSILIEYDFKRDGWSIRQASRFFWGHDEVPDPDWQEVAFVQAWAREVSTDD